MEIQNRLKDGMQRAYEPRGETGREGGPNGRLEHRRTPSYSRAKRPNENDHERKDKRSSKQEAVTLIRQLPRTEEGCKDASLFDDHNGCHQGKLEDHQVKDDHNKDTEEKEGTFLEVGSIVKKDPANGRAHDERAASKEDKAGTNQGAKGVNRGMKDTRELKIFFSDVNVANGAREDTAGDRGGKDQDDALQRQKEHHADVEDLIVFLTIENLIIVVVNDEIRDKSDEEVGNVAEERDAEENELTTAIDDEDALEELAESKRSQKVVVGGRFRRHVASMPI